ncbi:SRPBCC family protein [Sphingomonas sp. ERG5]|uniref:SRPBCC family protein n=1 Tax=Sphingomonas sp. ERG5 TaxID=1381597 RepID=UPI00054B2389|nr:SRPBCC domain-containing protein [Sphingomonas sp. ERG5]
MTDRNFTIRFTVDQSPETVVAAINNVRGWWSHGIVGNADRVGARFTYAALDLHRCDLAVTEMVPGKKIAWLVLDNYFSFTRDTTEWTGTSMVFEIARIGDQTEVRFTHVGLVPDYECYDICHDGWTTYIQSLGQLITTGKGNPNIGEPMTDTEVALVQARAGALTAG